MHDLQEIYGEFLTKFANLPIPTLLPELQVARVIDENERAIIENQKTPIDQRIELFMKIMPPKDADCHKKLVDVLSNNNMNEPADYLRSNISHLIIQNSTTTITILKTDEKPTYIQQLLIKGYRKELRKQKKKLGKNSPELIDMYIRLAKLYFEIEHYPKTVIYYERTIQIMDSTSKLIDSELHAWTVYDLACTYFDKLYRFAEAEKLFKQCLFAFQNHFGFISEPVLYTSYYYAHTCRYLRNYIAAEEMLQTSLEIANKLYDGSLSAATFSYILYDFGLLYEDLRRLEEAKLKLEQFLLIQQNLLPNPDKKILRRVFRTFSILANLYWIIYKDDDNHDHSMNMNTKAQTFCNRALYFCQKEGYQIQRKDDYLLLIKIYFIQSNFDEMERICGAALKFIDDNINEKSVTNNAISKIQVLYHLSQSYFDRNRLLDALITCKSAIELLDKIDISDLCNSDWCFKSICLYACISYTMENYAEFEEAAIRLLKNCMNVCDDRFSQTEIKNMLSIFERLVDYCDLRRKVCNIDLIKLTRKFFTIRYGPCCTEVKNLRRIERERIADLKNTTKSSNHCISEKSKKKSVDRKRNHSSLSTTDYDLNEFFESTVKKQCDNLDLDLDVDVDVGGEDNTDAKKGQRGFNVDNNDYDEDHGQLIQTTGRFWFLTISKVKFLSAEREISRFCFSAKIDSVTYFSATALSDDEHSVRIFLPDDADEITIFVEILEATYVNAYRSIASGTIHFLTTEFQDANMLSWLTTSNGSEMAVEWMITESCS